MSWIKWTEEELAELTNLGAVFFSAEQCAILLEKDAQVLAAELKDPEAPSYKAYQKGFLQSLYAVRKNTIEMAKNGSSPAQTMAEKLVKNYEYEQAVKTT